MGLSRARRPGGIGSDTECDRGPGGLLGVADRDGPQDRQEHYGIYRPDGKTPFPVEELPLTRALAGESTEQVEMVIRNASCPDGVVITVSGRPLRTAQPAILTGALPVAHGDAGMLRQLLDNLIGNSLKFTRPGQPATIDISAEPAGDGWTRVQVADRGIGIPMDDQPHVFTSFHRAAASP